MECLPNYPLLDLKQPILISSATGVGAESVARILSSPEVPWYRGDAWGSRPSGDEEEWTYAHSSFDLPSSPRIASLTDGSDMRPWERFLSRHPDFLVIRLVCSPDDLLIRKNRWREKHSLPPLSSISPRARSQLACPVDKGVVFSWPDLFIERERCEFILDQIARLALRLPLDI